MPTAATAVEVVAENAAVVLGYGTPSQSVVKGLNKLGLPVASRSEIKLSEFRRDFATKVLGEGEWSNITFAGNLVKGDRLGQSALKKAMIAKTKITDCRIYLNDTDFVAPDLANDPASSLQVLKAGDGGSTDKNAVFPFSGEMILNGRVAYFFDHMPDVSLAFVAGSSGVSDTITDAASGFVTAGFEVGDTLIVEGSTGNDGQYLIKTVAAGTLTLETEGEITTHAAEVVTLHGGTL
ncbi:hypothetical protein [Solidesulfovibrio sp.]